MGINTQLKKYIEENIFPQYTMNENGHQLDHIEYVIKRSIQFAKSIPDINLDMVYTIAAYHDIGHRIDPKNHEKVSGEILLKDKNLRKYFTEEQINIMFEAVCDHRASNDQEPRSIYGKIVSSADRNTSVESSLRRTYLFRHKLLSQMGVEKIMEESRQHLIDKFGPNGYAQEKMYFEDEEYKQYLKDINELIKDNEKFVLEYKRVNNL